MATPKPFQMFPNTAPPVDPIKKQLQEESKISTPEAPEMESKGKKFKAADFSVFKQGTPKQDEKFFPDLKK